MHSSSSVVCSDSTSPALRATFMARTPVDGLPTGQNTATVALATMKAASRRGAEQRPESVFSRHMTCRIPFFSAEAPVVVTLRHGPMLSGTPSGLGWASLELVLDESTVPALREFYERTGVDPGAHLGLLLGLGGSATIGVDVTGFSSQTWATSSWSSVDLRRSPMWPASRIDFDGELGGLRFEGRRAERLEVGQAALGGSPIQGSPRAGTVAGRPFGR